MSMSVSAWITWVEDSIRATTIRDDDPPPPVGPIDGLDRKIQEMIEESLNDGRNARD